VIEPCLSEQLVVSFLVEEKLMVATQSGINLTVAVQVRRMVPATMAMVQEQDHALANVDEYANTTATPVFLLVMIYIIELS
jgi:hypothetical protein